jgi:hypothetical protein
MYLNIQMKHFILEEDLVHMHRCVLILQCAVIFQTGNWEGSFVIWQTWDLSGEDFWQITVAINL